MRISYRKRNETIWKEIPNVIMPISISDVADDSFDNVKLSFLLISILSILNPHMSMMQHMYQALHSNVLHMNDVPVMIIMCLSTKNMSLTNGFIVNLS